MPTEGAFQIFYGVRTSAIGPYEAVKNQWRGSKVSISHLGWPKIIGLYYLDVDVESVHEIANTLALLADDEAMVLKRHLNLKMKKTDFNLLSFSTQVMQNFLG